MKSLQRTYEIHSEENSRCPAAPPENPALAGIKRGSEMLKRFYAGAPVDTVHRFQVFMAEFFASRPIILTIQADDEETITTRSSGICVCTGSGSRSWFRTMNLQSTETVQMLAAMATGKQFDGTKTDELLLKYHNNLLFPPGNPALRPIDTSFK